MINKGGLDWYIIPQNPFRIQNPGSWNTVSVWASQDASVANYVIYVAKNVFNVLYSEPNTLKTVFVNLSDKTWRFYSKQTISVILLQKCSAVNK